VLESLTQLVDGSVAESRLRGSYEGYGVEAWSTNERPAPDVPAAQGGSRSAGPKVNVFHLELIGVPGRHFWDCRSTPSLLGNVALVLPSQIGYRLIKPQFAFHEPRGGWLAKKFGVAPADPAAQERLRAVGLFDELTALRWGSNPFLPKAVFDPHAQAIGEGFLGGYEARLKDALERSGHPELEAVVEEKSRAVREDNPGQLSLEVELGKERAPTEERFRELLDRAVRIARLNAQAEV
jgi:hypothetical protein